MTIQCTFKSQEKDPIDRINSWFYFSQTLKSEEKVGLMGKGEKMPKERMVLFLSALSLSLSLWACVCVGGLDLKCT
jgi:hypothetical protein